MKFTFDVLLLSTNVHVVGVPEPISQVAWLDVIVIVSVLSNTVVIPNLNTILPIFSEVTKLPNCCNTHVY